MIFKILGILSFLITLSACQTGVFIRESPAAMTDIRKAAVSVLGEPRAISHDGRELTSKFHDKRGRFEENLARAKTRYFTVVTIRGERRPYNIQIEVFQEARMDSTKAYQIIGEDQQLAKKTAAKIEHVLNESLKNRNVIDDFKAF